MLLALATARATSNYDYGPDEYVTVANGISPDGKFAITAHGVGDMGLDEFHLYLTDAATGKKLATLAAVDETLDTGAGAFAAKWASDSQEVTVIYRVDRHAPLKAVSYGVAGGNAELKKAPFDARDAALVKYWQSHSSDPKKSPKIFGKSLKE